MNNVSTRKIVEYLRKNKSIDKVIRSCKSKNFIEITGLKDKNTVVYRIECANGNLVVTKK